MLSAVPARVTKETEGRSEEAKVLGRDYRWTAATHSGPIGGLPSESVGQQVCTGGRISH